MVLDDLPIDDLLEAWMERALRHQLPTWVRDTRRETHFLRGVRPTAILMADERGTNRPLLAAAGRLGIPTVALQLRPYETWDDSYLAPLPDPGQRGCIPDRLCVFTPAVKAQLVEGGAFEPSAIVVTGDPRLETLDPGGAFDEGQRRRVLRRWGVENGQRVVALTCTAEECSLVLPWMGQALAGRQDVFVVLGVPDLNRVEAHCCRRLAVARGLRWLHLLSQQQVDEHLETADLLVTSSASEISEGILHGLPVVRLELDGAGEQLDPDPGGLVRSVVSAAQLGSEIENALTGRFSGPKRSDPEVAAYLRAVYGSPTNGAAHQILETILGLCRRS
jgi:hypothetical protein